MDNNPEHYEKELDLSQLLRILWNRWYIILLAVIAIVTITSVYSYVLQDDVYTARVTFAVRVDDTEINPATGFQLAERLVNSYVEFSTSRVVLDQLRISLNALVVGEGDLEDYQGDTFPQFNNRQLTDMITTSGRGNTIVLDISVNHTDPIVATVVANTLIDVIDDLTASDQIKNLQIIDIWGYAEIPSMPSGPNRPLYMLIGLVLGLMIGVFTVFIIEFFDKTIKTTQDIETKLQLRVLGIIPDYEFEDVEVIE